MSEDNRSRDDPRRHSPFATGGLNARLQSLLSAVLPVAGVPTALHVDQDALMEGGELFPVVGGWGLWGAGGGCGGEWRRSCRFFEDEPFHRDLYTLEHREYL
jgi:hypothetical protein